MAAEEEGCSVLGKWEFQKALQQSILWEGTENAKAQG